MPINYEMSSNDLFIMAIKNDGKAFIIIARQNSTAEHQLAWLFNLPEHSGKSFAVQEESDNDSIKTGIFSQHLLEQLGIVLPSTEESCLEEMLCKFNGKFPSTLEFSAFAREKVGDFDAYDNRADDVLRECPAYTLLYQFFPKDTGKSKVK